MPAKRNSSMSEKEYFREMDRIERNSHRFLTYFGIFWGAILIFIVQNYNQNSIAKTLGDQTASFFANPFGTLNMLGAVLLYLGIIFIAFSLIMLMAVAAMAGRKIQNKMDTKFLAVLDMNFLKSILLGLFGSFALIFLFVLSLMMNSGGTLQNNAVTIGNIFFYVIFIAIFFFDPAAILYQSKGKGFWRWVNFVVAWFIGIVFILSKFMAITPVVLLIFLLVFLAYVPVRIILTTWKKKFFIIEKLEWIFPDMTWGRNRT
jgi:hypothetical protein